MATTQPQSRLQQTLSHLQHPQPLPSPISLVTGPTHPPLLDLTLGQLLARQTDTYGDLECLVFPWTGARWSYSMLNNEADKVARGLLAMGVQKGDRVGIMAGNCEEYISVFFGVARVGAILIVLNNTYTAAELDFALSHTGLFTVPAFLAGIGADAGTRLSIFVSHSPNWTAFTRRHAKQTVPAAQSARPV